MSTKLKVLSLGLLSTLVMSAVVAISASANVSGHFTQGVSNSTITGREGGEHRIKFSVDGGTPIECDSAHYDGTPEPEITTQRLLVTPTYTQCHTEGGAPGSVVVDHRGCEFEFYSNSGASTHSPTAHATTGLVCPEGINGLLVTHPNCTMRMPPQTLSDITYTTITLNGKHAITLNSTVGGITAHYEAGICIFLGTSHTGTMNGSATVEAFNGINNPVDITAT